MDGAAAGAPGATMAFLPQLFRGGNPILSIGDAAVAEGIGRLGGLIVGVHRASLPDHVLNPLGVFQHGARPQHVFVERLVVVIGLEKGTFQSLQKGVVVDVHVGVMDEHAGLHVALGVDMQVPSAAGNAAAHVLCVVLEVHAEDGLALTVGADSVVHLLALLRVREQLQGGVTAHGHIVEEPHEESAAVDHKVKELLTAQILIILAGVAGGDSEG